VGVFTKIENIQRQRISTPMATWRLPFIKLTPVDLGWAAEVVLGSVLIYKGFGTLSTNLMGYELASSGVVGIGAMIFFFGLARIANFLEEEVNLIASWVLLAMLLHATGITPDDLKKYVKDVGSDMNYYANVANVDGAATAKECQWKNIRTNERLTGAKAEYCANAVKIAAADAKFCKCE
jgi:hypothetical protein